MKNNNKWYKSTWFTILMLVIFFPVGLFLMWKYMNWKTWVKVVITVAIALIVIGNMGKSPSTNKSNNSNEVKNEQSSSNDNEQNTASNDDNISNNTEENESSNKSDDNPTREQKSALNKAKTYSDTMNMSKQGIYDQLTSEAGEQFPAEAAQYAVDNLKADYNKNALKKAETYADTMDMSNDAIFDQLTSEAGEKFTTEQAQYAVDHLDK